MIKKLFLPLSLVAVCFNGFSSEVVIIDPVKAFLNANLHDARNRGFHKVLNLIEKRNAKIIVETGTSRGGHMAFTGDGGFTIIFGLWATLNKAHLYSVDISAQAIKNAKTMVTQFADHITFTEDDSVHFLKEFPHQIDFLYLDSFDYVQEDPLPSQIHHVKEIQAVYDKLHADTVIMIDDCDLPGGGKGRLVIDYLCSKGWKVIFKSYQVILVYKGDELPLKRAL